MGKNLQNCSLQDKRLRDLFDFITEYLSIMIKIKFSGSKTALSNYVLPGFSDNTKKIQCNKRKVWKKKVFFVFLTIANFSFVLVDSFYFIRNIYVK